MGSVNWQINKSPLACIKYMLKNQINCDVNFRIGENQENVKAHKLILSMRSPVFDRMFNGCFEESEKDPVIQDVTAAAFQTLLRYCYYECLDMKDDVAVHVLYAATKYMLPILGKAAGKKVKQILDASNVWDIYKCAIDLGDTKLNNVCKMYFKGDITPVKEALQTEAFLNIEHEVLLDFLHINDSADNISSLNTKLENGIDSEDKKRNDKNGNCTSESDRSDDPDSDDKEVYYENITGISISEIELFKACDAWAEAECLRQEIKPTGTNKRTVLGEALFLIRLPTVLLKDLMTVVFPTGILTPAEMVSLGQYVHRDTGSECPVNFPSKERQFVVTAPKITATVPSKCTVYAESDVRVMLSRVWVLRPGRYIVTVRNETSAALSSSKYDTKYQDYLTEEIKDKRFMLYFLDIKPQLLEPDTTYSITIEEINDSDPADHSLLMNWVIIGKLSPFKEVHITQDPEKRNTIYALTLCLV